MARHYLKDNVRLESMDDILALAEEAGEAILEFKTRVKMEMEILSGVVKNLNAELEKKREKPEGSYKSEEGKAYTDCAECKRGGNGNNGTYRCRFGGQIKEIDKSGCFSGMRIGGEPL